MKNKYILDKNKRFRINGFCSKNQKKERRERMSVKNNNIENNKKKKKSIHLYMTLYTSFEDDVFLC